MVTKHILTLLFPPPPNTGFVYIEKSAGTGNPLMICFQESLNCYGGRPTASPPTLAMQTERPNTQESSRRPTLVPHPCSPVYPIVYMPSLLLNYQGCSAAPNRSLGHRHMAGPSVCPGCCHGLERLLGLVFFVLRNCLLITLVLFLS